MLEIESEAFPVLVSLTFCAALVVPGAWLANVRLAGESVTAGEVCSPVPERVTDCGLAGALSAKLTVAERAPLAEGVKFTVTMQLAPAARVDPHVLV